MALSFKAGAISSSIEKRMQTNQKVMRAKRIIQALRETNLLVWLLVALEALL